MKLARLDHFGIEVSDLARAERFYGEVLGLARVGQFGDLVLFECGGQNLALHHVARPPLDPRERAARIQHPLSRAHHAFAVSESDFAAAPRTLSVAGVESSRVIDWGDHQCRYFLDPDGNLLEIVNYPKGRED